MFPIFFAPLAVLCSESVPFPPPRRYSCFPFSLSLFLLLPPPLHFPFSRTPLFRVDLSPSRSPCRLFTLLIPQHPPRNNDVRPCFSCFSSSLSIFSSFSFFQMCFSLSLPLPFSIGLLVSLSLFHSFSRYFHLLFSLNVPIYLVNVEENATGYRTCERIPSRFSSKNEEFFCAHIFPRSAWKIFRRTFATEPIIFGICRSRENKILLVFTIKAPLDRKFR